MQVRPTSDRLRETLFNVLAPRIQEARFLDLCAGSGAVGIEALSRGATHSTFVDRSRKMCGLIQANLDLCNISDEQTEVVTAEANDFLKRQLKLKSEPWDIIFYDPPYGDDYRTLLTLIGDNSTNLMQTGGIVVVEHHHKNDLGEQFGSIMRTRILKQGDSALSFYQSQDSED